MRVCYVTLQAFRFGYAPFRFAHFASVMLHFALLISHNLRCIPAYTHQIPPGFSIILVCVFLGGGVEIFFVVCNYALHFFCTFMPIKN